jgi:putative ABC transport system permease protein
MYGIALKMLLGDRGKYLGIVIGIALSSFIMIQQPGVFPRGHYGVTREFGL